MSLRLPKNKTELFEPIIKGHIEADFIPLSDFNLQLYGYGVLNSNGKINKMLISDIDGVLTSTPIFFGYVKRLSDINQKLKEYLPGIFQCLSSLSPDNVEKVTEYVSERFRISRVKEWQHLKATDEYLDYGFETVPGSKWMLSRAKEMGYETHLITGSPDGAAKKFAERLLDIRSDNVIGSEYIFVNGEFSRIEQRLYRKKKEIALDIMKDKLGTDSGYVVFLSDELDDFRDVGMFFHTLLLLNEKEDSVEKTVIEFKENERTPESVIKSLQKIERGMCMYFGYSPKEISDILGSAFNLEKSFEGLTDEQNESSLYKLKEEMLEHFKNYKKSASDIFPIYLSNIENFEYSLKFENNLDEIKIIASDFMKEFKKYSPDITVSKKVYSL